MIANFGDLDNLVRQGSALARQGQRGRAKSFFSRVLARNPDHIDALLWMAALDENPRTSMVYLERVLAISPDHPRARAGLHWAQKKVNANRVRKKTLREDIAWLDTMLLSAIVLVILSACATLTWMIWQTPAAVRAAYQPTATFAPPVTTTPTLIPTFTPMPTFTPTPTPTPTFTPEPTATPTPAVPGEPSMRTDLGEKWIDIELSTQTLTAFEGDTPVLSALVSTGVPGLPTPPGEYTIYLKIRSQVMSGPGYYLPNVEFVSYFYKGYALHGTYWHNNFGHPMSHGCVNMTNADAKWIYEWAPKETRVRVHY
ncbi:MAG: L,D-transpeptidase family protein [Anaerolineae bacterium]|nr:L,D-transpeptidase family protein [Anaerolineae bacterium]